MTQQQIAARAAFNNAVYLANNNLLLAQLVLSRSGNSVSGQNAYAQAQKDWAVARDQAALTQSQALLAAVQAVLPQQEAAASTRLSALAALETELVDQDSEADDAFTLAVAPAVAAFKVAQVDAAATQAALLAQATAAEAEAVANSTAQWQDALTEADLTLSQSSAAALAAWQTAEASARASLGATLQQGTQAAQSAVQSAAQSLSVSLDTLEATRQAALVSAATTEQAALTAPLAALSSAQAQADSAFAVSVSQAGAAWQASQVQAWANWQSALAHAQGDWQVALAGADAQQIQTGWQAQYALAVVREPATQLWQITLVQEAATLARELAISQGADPADPSQTVFAQIDAWSSVFQTQASANAAAGLQLSVGAGQRGNDQAQGQLTLAQAQAAALEGFAAQQGSAWLAFAATTGTLAVADTALSAAAQTAFAQAREGARLAEQAQQSAADALFAQAAESARQHWLYSQQEAAQQLGTDLLAALAQQTRQDSAAAQQAARSLNAAGLALAQALSEAEADKKEAKTDAEAAREVAGWQAWQSYAAEQTEAQAERESVAEEARGVFQVELSAATLEYNEDTGAAVLSSRQQAAPVLASYQGLAVEAPLQSAVTAAEQTLAADQGSAPSQFSWVSARPLQTLWQQGTQAMRAGGGLGGFNFAADVYSNGAWSQTLTSEQFTQTLNATDAFFAGWSGALTWGATTKLRGAIYGETATQNHQGKWFVLGTAVGTVHMLALEGANPCNMSALGGAATRGLEATQLVGGTLGAVENFRDGNFFAAGMELLAVTSKFNSLMRSCFAARTPILVPEGSKFIEELRPGDLVLCRDENNPDGPVVARVVEEVFVRTGKLLNLQVAGRVIKTSAEHPFWVRGKGWTIATLLLPGDELSTHDGRWVAVEAVEDEGEYATLYNICVVEHHTYFVGCEEWLFSVWAHNDEYQIERGRNGWHRIWNQTRRRYETRPDGKVLRIRGERAVFDRIRSLRANDVLVADAARATEIAEQMAAANYTPEEIASWRAAASNRTDGRVARIHHGDPETLHPYPAPWEV